MAEDSRVGFSVVTFISWVQDIDIYSPAILDVISLEEAKSIEDFCNSLWLARGCKD